MIFIHMKILKIITFPHFKQINISFVHRTTLLVAVPSSVKRLHILLFFVFPLFLANSSSFILMISFHIEQYLLVRPE